MRKNVKVIEINGIRGLIKALAILCCLVAGFVAFPGMVLMYGWNHIVAKYLALPIVGLIQGILLWGIVVVSYMILKKRQVMVCFKNPTELSDEELKDVMDRIKYETTAQMMEEVMRKAKIEHDKCIKTLDSKLEEQENVMQENKNVDN